VARLSTMHLHRLILKNVAQHEHLDLTFEPGLVAILGPNGCGKSNVLNAAYAALSGDFSRHSGGKGGFIRQGSSGESYIEVHAEHAGTSFVLRRGLRPSRQWLELGGETFDKAQAITEVLSEHLGVTPELLDNYVFVAQWELFGFLGTPTERARNIARLCQTDKAERLWELLGRQIDKDRSLGIYAGEDPETLRAELALAEQSLQEAKAALDSALSKCLDQEDLEELTAVLRNYEKQALLKSHLEEAAKQLEIWHSRLQEAEEKAKVSSERWQRLSEELAAIEEPAQAARAKLEALQMAARITEARQKIKRRLANLKEPTPPDRYDDDWPTSVELQKRLAKREAELARQQNFVKRCAGKPACPVCGTPSETFAEQLAEAERSIPALAAEIEDLRQELAAVEAHEEACRQYREEHSAWERTRKELQEQLATLQEAGPTAIEEDREVLEEVIERWKQLRAKVAQADSFRQGDIERSRKAAAQVATYQMRVAELQRDISNIHVTEAMVEHARARCRAHEAAQREAAAAKAKVETFGKIVEEKRRKIAEADRRLSEAARGKRWLELLAKVRDVFHRDRLPAILHRHALRVILDKTNEILEQFESPFYVTGTDDLEILAHKADVRVAASDLSGGEKMVLGTAFRLAANALFADQVGLLALDEPTAALDEANTLRMVEVFDRLRHLARRQGYQIILVTHERLLEPVFDRVVFLPEVARTRLEAALP